jgi:hypothetical protein
MSEMNKNRAKENVSRDDPAVASVKKQKKNTNRRRFACLHCSMVKLRYSTADNGDRAISDKFRAARGTAPGSSYVYSLLCVRRAPTLQVYIGLKQG